MNTIFNLLGSGMNQLTDGRCQAHCLPASLSYAVDTNQKKLNEDCS